MKIIDLFVKRANNEEMPKKIKYDLKEYIYCGYDYKINDVEKQNDDDYNLWNNLDMYKLNNEIEIIEEDKKIEHCLKSDRFLRDEDEIEHFRTKIDELIDEVNKLKGEK